MGDKGRTRGIFKVYLQWLLFLSVPLIILTAAAAAVPVKAGIIVSVFTIAYIGTALWLYFSRKRGILAGLIMFSSAYDQSRQNLLGEMLMPYVTIDGFGYLLWMNREFTVTLEEDKSSHKNITVVFPEITKEMLATGGEVVSIHSSLGDRKFRIDSKQVTVDSLDVAVTAGGFEGQGSFVMVVYLLDETQTLKYIQQVNDQKLVTGLIYLDNCDEALESMEKIRRSLLTVLIDRKISRYISGMNSIVKKIEKDKYFSAIKQQYTVGIQEECFSILEGVKTVNIGSDMAVTLSIGIGMNGDSYSQNYEYARMPIDMALGRGGDQTVVRDPDKIQYYDDKAQQMEKTIRVKARMKAHTFRELIENKDRLLIMGHRLADIDSFGAAVGIYRIAMSMNKRANIVVNKVTSLVRPTMECFTGNAEYPEDMLLAGLKVAELVDQGITLVIVDVNRSSITNEPAFLEMVKTVVALDHHRTSSEIIDDVVLSYVEPHTSSTCETMAGVLQYTADGIKIKSAEVDAMYASIVIDTQNFANRAGVRAFEAAALLGRSGADIIRVCKLFRENMKDYQAKADAVREAEVFMDVFVISEYPAEGLESLTIIGAQAASEFLEIRGMEVLVVFTDYNGTIYFSVRSTDEVNVQTTMGKLGGGGHRTIADAQMQGVTVEEAEGRLKDVIHQIVEEGEVS